MGAFRRIAIMIDPRCPESNGFGGWSKFSFFSAEPQAGVVIQTSVVGELEYDATSRGRSVHIGFHRKVISQKK